MEHTFRVQTFLAQTFRAQDFGKQTLKGQTLRMQDFNPKTGESFDGGRVSRVGWAIECCSSERSDSRILGPVIYVDFEGSGSKDYSIPEVSEILWQESFD